MFFLKRTINLGINRDGREGTLVLIDKRKTHEQTKLEDLAWDRLRALFGYRFSSQILGTYSPHLMDIQTLAREQTLYI